MIIKTTTQYIPDGDFDEITGRWSSQGSYQSTDYHDTGEVVTREATKEEVLKYRGIFGAMDGGKDFD